MDDMNQGNNCYRAILAQINCLEGVWPEQSTLKQIYEELTELAFYMMEKDSPRVARGIDQISATLDEIKSALPNDNSLIEVKMIVSELKTHLDFLRWEYSQADS